MTIRGLTILLLAICNLINVFNLKRERERLNLLEKKLDELDELIEVKR